MYSTQEKNGRHLLEKEEEAAADQLHLPTLLDVAVEQPEQLGDVGERQDQQRHLQLTGDHKTARIKNTHTHRHTAPQKVVIVMTQCRVLPRSDLLYDV